MPSLPVALVCLTNAPLRKVFVGFVEDSVYSTKEIVVVIDTRGSNQLLLFDIGCWVAFSITRRTLLMSLIAGQGACFDVVTGADIFRRIDITDMVSGEDDEEMERKTYQMLQRLVRGAS